MKATDTISKIKNILGMELSKEVKEVEVKAEEVTLATMNLENGTVIEAESFENGKEVFIVTEDDRVPMPVGEYTLEDGRSVVVKEEGLIDSISEATEEVEEEVETSKEDVKAED
jgi:predicted RNA-binding protein with PUA domain